MDFESRHFKYIDLKSKSKSKSKYLNGTKGNMENEVTKETLHTHKIELGTLKLFTVFCECSRTLSIFFLFLFAFSIGGSSCARLLFTLRGFKSIKRHEVTCIMT